LTLNCFNQSWHLGHQHELYLTELPPCLTIPLPSLSPYDELLPLRRAARVNHDWALADALRDAAEIIHGMTIVDCPEESSHSGHDFQYFAPVRVIPWYRKWRPYLGTTNPDKDLDSYATDGYGRYAPGSITLVS